MSKPLTGHFKKGDVAPKKTLKEFRFSDCGAYNVGDLIKADVFANGDKVDVTGTSRDLKRPTVPARLHATAVPTVLAPARPEFGRA